MKRILLLVLLTFTTLHCWSQTLNYGDKVYSRFTDEAFFYWGWHISISYDFEVEAYHVPENIKSQIQESNSLGGGRASGLFYGELYHLQFIVWNGDTVNYYDSHDMRQGLHIVSYYHNDGKGVIDKNPFSRYIVDPILESKYVGYIYGQTFRSDSLLNDFYLGLKASGQMDTIFYIGSHNDTSFFRRYIITDSVYSKQIYRITDGVSAPDDTIFYFYNTGELFCTRISSAPLLRNYFGLEQSDWSEAMHQPITTFWQNGKERYTESIDLIDDKRKVANYYRKDGTLFRKEIIKYGYVIEKECYDHEGRLVDCNSHFIKKFWYPF